MGAVCEKHRVQDVSFHGDFEQSRKQAKCRRNIGNTQALQVVTGMPPTSASGGSTPAASARGYRPLGL
ncbi:UNVERIFIED_CONTAM: hypothetical protein Slati_0497800 [Sesamum latifolium]|uniref:Uncharacterized protein n=1 Tax=Sesamum latifolium TaxID=2727402 RepID=A0AAW2XXZ6_9LAMI